MAVFDGVHDHIRELLLAVAAFAINAELKHVRAGACRPQLHAELLAELVVLAPHRQPFLQELLRHFGLHEMLVLRGALAHGLGGRRAPRGGGQRGVAARPADQGLRRAVRRLDQAQLALQAGQRQHAVLFEGGGELLGGDAVDLVSAVGHEVEDEAHLGELFGEGPHLVVAHPGGVPVERRGEVVGQHLVGELRMDRVGELPGIGEIRGLRLHPEQIGERRSSQRLGDRVRDAAAELVVTFGRPRPLAVPSGVGAQLPRLLPGVIKWRAFGELPPLRGAHVGRFALVLAEFEQLRHGRAVGLQPGVCLPGSDKARLDIVEQCVKRLLAIFLPRGGRLGDRAKDALALQPWRCRGVLAFGQRVEEMPVELFDSQLVEAAQHRQEAGFVGGNLQVGDTEQERLVAFVGSAVDEVGRLGVRARDDDAGHPHHVELEAGGVEALDLFVRRHQHLAALVAALLRARALVLDVVARHAHLDEAADQVAYVRIAAVAGVGVGDDERAVVGSRGRGALRFCHAQSQVLLIAVRCEQGAHKAGRLVRHLAQGVAREIGSRILADGALRRRRPAAQVDPLDAHPLHRHGLPRRVWAEGGDALALGEELTQPVVESGRRFSGNDVVRGDRAALLDDLAGTVKADDPVEARTVEVSLRCRDVLLERVGGL